MSDAAGGSGQEMTPEQKREMLGVNSPKAQKGNNVSIFPTHLMTQVNQEDEEKRQAELKTRQAEEEVTKGTEEEKNKRQQHQLEVTSAERPEDSGFFQKCCDWFCCSSSPPPDVVSNEARQDFADDNVEVQTAEVTEQTIATKDAGVEETPKLPDEAQMEESTASESLPPGGGLLGKTLAEHKGRKCLVLDLDETLVHSSFQEMDCSFSLPIELGGMRYEVYVLKRPHVDEFIKECAKTYELVIFTASLAEYANPVIDTLDKAGLIKHRLFRESCVLHQGSAYVKDLSRLGRKLRDCIIIDNSPLSYMYDRYNAIACTSWFGDKDDTELRDLLPVLNGSLSTVKDVRTMLDGKSKSCQWLIDNYGKPKQ